MNKQKHVELIVKLFVLVTTVGIVIWFSQLDLIVDVKNLNIIYLIGLKILEFLLVRFVLGILVGLSLSLISLTGLALITTWEKVASK